MKKIILPIILIGFISQLMSQSNNVQKYYYWVNQAELAICDSNYAYANECYDKAFECHKPLGIHLSTAYLMNTIFTNDSLHIYKYASQLLLCGNNGLALGYAKANTNYDTCIYNRLLNLESSINPTFDTILHKKLINILDMDQSYRHSFQSNKREDSLNSIVIKEIFTLYSSYETINDFTAGLHFANYYLRVPALHYVEIGRHDLQDLLKKEVLKGNLRADMYMELEDWYLWDQSYLKDPEKPRDPNEYGLSFSYFEVIGNFLFVTRPTNINKVNRHRKQIGISESFEDFEKKVVWQYTTGKLFWTLVTRSRFGDDEEDAQYAKELIQEIETEHAANDFHRYYYQLPPREK